MPLSDLIRLSDQQTQSRIVLLWQAVQRLKTLVSFMNSGAHPDDEISEMLAALSLRDGVDISYACATRGEGGQNALGTETGAALGVLRTIEMERAADILGLRLYWLSESPDDTISDFGFSKSGTDTLERWDRGRTLARMVDILRRERPDCLCPTFLDVPGQHGHHRAMTETAERALEAAADPGYKGSKLPPWQVAKFYLPAWSGAGQSYDDDVPPPPATLTISGTGTDPVTGWSFHNLGQMSRACHHSQGMGRWIAPDDEHDWPLHLKCSTISGEDISVLSGLPETLADLGSKGDLTTAQTHIDAVIAAFPNGPDMVQHAGQAHRLIQRAIDQLSNETEALYGHRLRRKLTQLAQIIRLASAVDIRGICDTELLRPGNATPLGFERHPGNADRIEITPQLPERWRCDADQISLGSRAKPGNPYPATYLPDAPPLPRLEIMLETRGVISRSYQKFEVTPFALPRYCASLHPDRDIINLATARREVAITLNDIMPDGAKPHLELPKGWDIAKNNGKFTITCPEETSPGLYEVPVALDRNPAQQIDLIARDPHLPRVLAREARVTIRVLSVTLPDVKIGYLGGGNDHVDHWLARLGFDVTPIEDAHLASDTTLADFDTIVVGIFAMRTRPALALNIARLHAWVAAGGTLVTLYHRPWDNWDPQTIPPRPIEIGQPSLRWRVTNPSAEVTHRDPDHAIFNSPNTIDAADWAGWHKERGLYFARTWDNTYRGLLAMADPDETDHHGALLSGDIGAGRHIHTSLSLHHQLEHLVPGAFRLMANLVAKRPAPTVETEA